MAYTTHHTTLTSKILAMPKHLFNLPSDPLLDAMSYLTFRDLFRMEATHPRFFRLLSSSYMDGMSQYHPLRIEHVIKKILASTLVPNCVEETSK